MIPVAHALRGEGFDASEDGTGRGTPIVPVQHPIGMVNMQGSKGQAVFEENPVTSYTLNAMHGHDVHAIALQDVRGMDKAQNGRGWNDDGTSYTVDALATQGVVQPHAIAIQERAVSENPDAGPDGKKGWRDDGAAYTLEARQVTQAVAAPVDSAFTFNTTQLTSPQNGQDLGPDKPCHSLAAKNHPPAVAIAFTAKDYGGDAIENVSPTLRAGGHTGSHANAGVMPAIAFQEGEGPIPFDPRQIHHPANHSRPKPGDPSHPLRAVANAEPAIASAWGVRRLTPTECARLQGFPDNWARIPWRGKPAEECPDGPQYKAFGNSMAVPVMEWIGERIEAIRGNRRT